MRSSQSTQWLQQRDFHPKVEPTTFVSSSLESLSGYWYALPLSHTGMWPRTRPPLIEGHQLELCNREPPQDDSRRQSADDSARRGLTSTTLLPVSMHRHGLLTERGSSCGESLVVSHNPLGHNPFEQDLT